MAPAPSPAKPAGKPGAPTGGAPTGGVKGRLTAKVGPLPVYAWALIIVGGYLAYRRFAGSSTGAGASSASPATPNTGDVGGTVGGAGDTSGAGGGSFSAAGPDPSSGSYDALLALLGQQTAALGDLSAQVQAGTPYAQSGGVEPQPGAPSLTKQQPGTYLDTTVNAQGVTQFTPIVQSHPYATAASTPDFAGSATQKTQAAKAAGQAAPFGGVVSVKKLANGSTLTTYASGRQVQQVPGKSAYVVKA